MEINEKTPQQRLTWVEDEEEKIWVPVTNYKPILKLKTKEEKEKAEGSESEEDSDQEDDKKKEVIKNKIGGVLL